MQFDIERARPATLVVVPEMPQDEPQVLAIPPEDYESAASALVVIGQRLAALFLSKAATNMGVVSARRASILRAGPSERREARAGGRGEESDMAEHQVAAAFASRLGRSHRT